MAPVQAKEQGWLPRDHRLAILQYAFWETDFRLVFKKQKTQRIPGPPLLPASGIQAEPCLKEGHPLGTDRSAWGQGKLARRLLSVPLLLAAQLECGCQFALSPLSVNSLLPPEDPDPGLLSLGRRAPKPLPNAAWGLSRLAPTRGPP